VHARGFGIFVDSAPDRWGRMLMERREASQAKNERRAMRRLTELDFMLGVQDFTRFGALRFRHGPDEPFIADHDLPAPPAADLRELATDAQAIIDDIRNVVVSWRDKAKELGISGVEVRVMESVFAE
jgi:serine/threonine-protein kinase HipA